MTVLERFYKENEMSARTPDGCDLKVGDLVIFRNDYGISFRNHIVIGFAKPENQVNGGFIHINTDCAWFPVKRESLTKQVIS